MLGAHGFNLRPNDKRQALNTAFEVWELSLLVAMWRRVCHSFGSDEIDNLDVWSIIPLLFKGLEKSGSLL